MNGSPSYDGWKLRSDLDDAPDPDEGRDRSGWRGSESHKTFLRELRDAANEREAKELEEAAVAEWLRQEQERRAAAMDDEAAGIADSEGWK